MMARIIDKIKEQIKDQLYQGAGLAVYNKGEWQEVFLGQHAPDWPVTRDSVYDVASVTKVLGVGTLLALLQEKGLLDLDRPFSSYFSPIHDKKVTLRELVTHTSGVNPYIPNRDQLNVDQLKAAICAVSFDKDKLFHYSDVNIILLGFWLEDYFGKDLEQLIAEQVLQAWGMTRTSYGPFVGAVPTLVGIFDGMVHDPKAKVLGKHCGSAGLFSDIRDLEIFLEHYLTDDFVTKLWENLAFGAKSRSLVWDLEGDWLLHTGYTGPFIMVNRKAQQAVIFLTNRTYFYDDRPLWIAKRSDLIGLIVEALAEDKTR